MSRLSKRTTEAALGQQPRRTRSGQPIICVARPMTSSTGGVGRVTEGLVGQLDLADAGPLDVVAAHARHASPG